MQSVSSSAASFLDTITTDLRICGSHFFRDRANRNTLTILRRVDQDLFELVEHDTDVVLPSRRILFWRPQPSSYCPLRSRGRDGLREPARVGRDLQGNRIVLAIATEEQASLADTMDRWLLELRSLTS